jgi:hypothetical protein
MKIQSEDSNSNVEISRGSSITKLSEVRFGVSNDRYVI